MEEAFFCLEENEIKAIIISFLTARGDKCADESEILEVLNYFDRIRFENDLFKEIINGEIGVTIVNKEVVYVSKDYREPRDKYHRHEIKQKSLGLCIKCSRPATSKTLCDYHREKKHEAYLRAKAKNKDVHRMRELTITEQYIKKDGNGHIEKLEVTKAPWGYTVDEIKEMTDRNAPQQRL